jgi:hypothetical protein
MNFTPHAWLLNQGHRNEQLIDYKAVYLAHTSTS